MASLDLLILSKIGISNLELYHMTSLELFLWSSTLLKLLDL